MMSNYTQPINKIAIILFSRGQYREAHARLFLHFTFQLFVYKYIRFVIKLNKVNDIVIISELSQLNIVLPQNCMMLKKTNAP